MRDGSDEHPRADQYDDESIVPDLTEFDPELGDLLDLVGPPPEPLPAVEHSPLPHRVPPPRAPEPTEPEPPAVSLPGEPEPMVPEPVPDDGLDIPHFAAAETPPVEEVMEPPSIPRLFPDEELPEAVFEGPSFITGMVEAQEPEVEAEPEPEPEPEPDPPRLPLVPLGELDGFAVQLGADLGASVTAGTARVVEEAAEPPTWYEPVGVEEDEPSEDLEWGEHVPPVATSLTPAPAPPTPAEWTPLAVERLGPSPCVEPVEPGGRASPVPAWRRHLLRIVVVVLIVAALAALLLTNPRRGDGDDDAGRESSPTSRVPAAGGRTETDPNTSLVAEVVVPLIDVYDSPNEDQPRLSLEHRSELGVPLVFLVKEHQGDWLQVYLPTPPNGSLGFVKTQDVELSKHSYKIEVRLAEHRLTLFKAGEVSFEAPVAIGTRDTPTPGGVFYIKELLKPPSPDTVYGNYAFGLSGFSETLEDFDDGEGVVGIHGTNDPSVIGKDVSAGCIRLTNEDMLKLVGTVPLGTPVEILA